MAAWLTLAATAAVAILVLAGCTKDVTPQTSAVTLEAATSAGDSPWTQSIAEPVDPSKVVTLDAKVTGPAGQGTTADGVTVGLYGGSTQLTICNKTRLVDFLESEPDKADAWRNVLGVGDIPDYVATLRPVVLMQDTLVTDHGFEEGHSTAFDALLQSGTAILVDPKWVPRVRCASGSPLTPADVSLGDTTYTGDQWTGWQEHKVVLPPHTTVETTSTSVTSETSEPVSPSQPVVSCDPGPCPPSQSAGVDSSTPNGEETDGGGQQNGTGDQGASGGQEAPGTGDGAGTQPDTGGDGQNNTGGTEGQGQTGQGGDLGAPAGASVPAQQVVTDVVVPSSVPAQ